MTLPCIMATLHGVVEQKPPRTAIEEFTSTQMVTRTGQFTKNDCPVGQTSRPVSVTKTYSATATAGSQTEADQLALSTANEKADREFPTDGQNEANRLGVCTVVSLPTYTETYNGVLTGSFTRNNCPTNHTTQPVTYTKQITATATSTVSRADALRKAEAEAKRIGNLTFATEGQDFANRTGVCTAPVAPQPIDLHVERINIRGTATWQGTGIGVQHDLVLEIQGGTRDTERLGIGSFEVRAEKTYPNDMYRTTEDIVTFSGGDISNRTLYVEVQGDGYTGRRTFTDLAANTQFKLKVVAGRVTPTTGGTGLGSATDNTYFDIVLTPV